MLLLTLVLAHLIADFYMQTDEMVIDKMKNIKKQIDIFQLASAS
ncbi:DUF3307 domain-containing protein [Neobacillus niacini]